MTKPFVLGITGSIGTGKSTTSQMFREAGVPVWDADAAVHRLYQKGGKAVPGIGRLYPDAIVDGAVDRAVLSAKVADDPAALSRIEAAVHPWLQSDRAAFIDENPSDIIGFDIPLLFETNADSIADAVLVVSIDAEEQRRRAMLRPGMTDAKFAAILERQIPDAQKRRRADFVIETTSMDTARQAVNDVILQIRAGLKKDA